MVFDILLFIEYSIVFVNTSSDSHLSFEYYFSDCVTNILILKLNFFKKNFFVVLFETLLKKTRHHLVRKILLNNSK